MRAHVTEETWSRLRRRELDPAELLDALAHLRSCGTCAARGEDLAAEGGAGVRGVLRMPAVERHLDPETELIAYVDGTLDRAERELADTHLDDCALCRADVEDLRAFARPRRGQRRVWTAALAVAATVAVIVTALSLVRQQTADAPPAISTPPLAATAAPPLTPPARPAPAATYGVAEWQTLVAEARATGRLPFPRDLDELRGRPEVLRGVDDAADETLQPAGVVVDGLRPELTWPARERATYVVVIYEDTTEIARSPELRDARWTPDRPLTRGRTYSWEVAVSIGGTTEILPSPPVPPARFRIVSARDHEALERARREHPRDFLLLAVLSARAGLRDDAVNGLRRARNAGDRDAEHMLEQTQSR